MITLRRASPGDEQALSDWTDARWRVYFSSCYPNIIRRPTLRCRVLTRGPRSTSWIKKASSAPNTVRDKSMEIIVEKLLAELKNGKKE